MEIKDLNLEKHSVSCLVKDYRLLAIRLPDDEVEVRTIGRGQSNGAAFVNSPEDAVLGKLRRNRFYPQIEEIEEMIPRLALFCWLKCEKRE